MVKSYQRFEQAKCFGVVSSKSNIVWLPPDNKFSAGKIITAGLEEVLIWDIKTGELLKRLRDGLPPGASDAKLTKPSEITAMAYHNDTNILSCGYNDGSIKVWDLISGTVVINFHGHKSSVTLLTFDNDGTRLISGSKDSNIIFWDLISEVGLFKLRGHKDQITGMWFNNEYLMSTSKDGLIKIWDLKSQQCIETHVAHIGECWGFDFFENLIISSGSDNELKVWNFEIENENGLKLKEMGSFEKQSKSKAVKISFKKNGLNLFFYVQNSDKTLEIFKIRSDDEISKASKKREKRLKEKGYDNDEISNLINESKINMLIQPFKIIRSNFKINNSIWSTISSSKLEIIISTSSNSLELYSIKFSNKEISTPNKNFTIDLQGHRNDIRALDISDNNKLIATASNGLLKIWNASTTNCLRTFDCGYALSIKFLPGSSLIVIGTRAGEIELYDLASSTLLESIQGHEGAIWSLDISSDGKFLVTGSADKKIKIWEFKLIDNVLKINHFKTLELSDDILSVKISPDLKFLAVSLLDNTIKVFYFDSLKFFLNLYGHKLPVLSIDISFDSKLLISSSADKNIKIWGLDFGDCHKSIFGHQDSIMNVKFLNDSHNFFSASKDSLLKYWDGDKFECIQKLSAHQSEIWCIAVSNDSSFVVSTSHDHSIRIWEETNDQVFIEEEKEKEMDELYESTLLSNLEGDDDNIKKNEDNEEEDNDEVTGVNQQTLETLKAGEKLLEAIELSYKDINDEETYLNELKIWNKLKTGEKPTKPIKDSLLQALNKTGTIYILEVLIKIKPSQLEDALLVLPFSFVLKFFKIIKKFIENKVILKERLNLICKILFFLIKSNLKELNNLKNEEIKKLIDDIKELLRIELKLISNEIGYNSQGLSFLKNQWNLRHNLEFIDDYENKENIEKTKRVYQTIK